MGNEKETHERPHPPEEPEPQPQPGPEWQPPSIEPVEP